MIAIVQLLLMAYVLAGPLGALFAWFCLLPTGKGPT